jgi:3-dehydroquinate synthase
MTTIQAKDYTIEIGSILDSSFGKILIDNYSGSKKIILVDENSHDFCLEYLITSFDELTEAEVMLLPVGEENKVMEVCFQVWEAMSEYKIGRNDLIINVGGGIVTDMGGFIASVYKRGIDFINIPTTLLAIVDASIGGKTGVDLGRHKNQLGTFSNPKALYIDSTFLGTLPENEILNGYAEMLKHGLIADKNYWNKLCNLSSMTELISPKMIIPSIQIKNNIVLNDPLEKNERKKLNFGHTIGHAIEGYFLDMEPISHGHAIAIGMLAEAFISYKRELLAETDWLEIEHLIRGEFPLIEIEKGEIETMIQLMKNDKKNFDGKIQCCLLTSIGVCIVNQPVSDIECKEAFMYLANLLQPS